MPSPGDPSFDRRARAARARQAVSDASDERLAELRAKRVAPASTRRESSASQTGARPRAGERPSIDAGAIGRTARAALDKHPATWTSYAELCSATGLTRSLAPVVARQMVPDPTGSHWFRIRDEDGVYNPPSDEADEGDAIRFSRAEADRELSASGVAVVDGRADPTRRLYWAGSGWGLPGSD